MTADVTLTENNLQDKIDTHGDLLVEFFSPTCGPCKMLNYVFEDVAKDLPDDYKILQVNYHENVELLEEFDIKSYPTVLIFKNREEVKRFSGVRTKEVILNHIEEGQS